VSVPEIEEINKSAEFFAKLKRIKINGKAIETPRKVISSSNNKYSENLVINNQEIKGMSEIFRKLDKPTLTSMKQYSAIERDVLNSLIKPVEQSYSPSNINYFLLRYDTRTDTEIKLKSRTSQVPNDEETRFLLDILTHRYNDFLIPPIMPYLTGDQIITFLNSFFELNSSFRNKTIAGLVPSTLSRDDQLKIIEFYI
jgi:hypothetical protein